ncbi:MAG: ABC transporter ATP-binding protein [candidate division WOR-3 bacterium]
MKDFIKLVKHTTSFKKFLRAELTLLALMLGQKGVVLVLPIASRSLIDTAVYSRDISTFRISSIIYILLILLFITLLSLRYLVEKTYSINFTNKLRQFVLKTLLNTKINHIMDKDEGYFIQRVNVNSKLVSEFLFSDVNIFITNVLLLIGALIMNFKLSPKLTLIILPVFPVFILFSKLLLPEIEKISHKLMTAEEDLATMVSENVQGYIHLRVNNLQGERLEKINSSLAKIFNLTKKYTLLEIVLDIVLVTGVLNFSEAIIRIVGGSMILNNTLTIGTLTAILTYFFRIWDTSESIMEFPKKYKTKVVSAKKLTELFNFEEECSPNISSKEPLDEFQELKMEDIYLSFPDKKIFEGLNLKVSKGDKMCILGDNGSGKTTLARMLIGLFEPQKGRITYNGVKLSKIPPSKLREKIVLVPHDPFVFKGSLKENISSSESLPEELAFEFLNRQSKDLSEVVDNKNLNLSAGEKKLITILRGIARNGDLYIFDEPTAYVDNFYKNIIIELITRRLRDKTVILITHDEEVCSSCSSRYMLKDGKLVKL